MIQTTVMDVEELRSFCLGLPHCTEDTPFDVDTLVFRVHGKIFALTSIADNNAVNLKCNPERAIQLREQFSAVTPGFHMNKTHWNTVLFNSDLKDSEILNLVQHSYELVFSSLPKKLKNPTITND